MTQLYSLSSILKDKICNYTGETPVFFALEEEEILPLDALCKLGDFWKLV